MLSIDAWAQKIQHSSSLMKNKHSHELQSASEIERENRTHYFWLCYLTIKEAQPAAASNDVPPCIGCNWNSSKSGGPSVIIWGWWCDDYYHFLSCWIEEIWTTDRGESFRLTSRRKTTQLDNKHGDHEKRLALFHCMQYVNVYLTEHH